MEIKRYIALVWHWLWLIILGTVLAGSLAYVINNNMTPIYRSTPVRLIIDQAPGQDYGDILVEKSLTPSYIQLIRTRPNLEETIERLGLPYTADGLRGMISVSAPLDTQIIDVVVVDADPARAADIANTLANVFIASNHERQSLRYSESISRYNSLLDTLRDEREDIQTQINNIGAAEAAAEQALLSRLEVQLNEVELRHTEIFNQLESVRVSQAKEMSNVVIIEEARPDFAPIQPRTRNNTIFAAVLGGMIALGFVFLIEYLDDTIKSPEDVQLDTGLSTLGAIAYIPGDGPDERLIAYSAPRAPVSEAFRVLRTNLSYSAVDEGLQTLMVTSASPGEGKSTTVANLGAVLAQTGQRVIIVDGDLRRPSQHRIFQVTNNQGLTTAILDAQTPAAYHLQPTKVQGLRLMCSGPIPPNPAELLNSQRMAQLIEELSREADIVLFDSPPVLSVADAAILAPKVKGCLMVIQAGETRRDLLAESAERLRKSGAVLFGVVLNRLKPGRGRYYDYYYYRYSEYQEMRTRRSGRTARLPGWLSGLTNRL